MQTPSRGEPEPSDGRDVPTIAPTQLPAEAVQTQLAKILASAVFIRSERLTRFLRFIVDQTLQGQNDNLKEYVLGVEVFGRGSSYDPHSDPIVRVEAGRLRTKLERYYEEEGRNDPVRIELPKGGYVPAFSRRQQDNPRAAQDRSRVGIRGQWKISVFVGSALILVGLTIYWVFVSSQGKHVLTGPLETHGSFKVKRVLTPAPGEKLSIVVLPFVDLSPSKDQEYLSDGMTEEVTDALSRVEDLAVVSRTSAFFYKGRPVDTRKIGAELNARLALEGSVRKEGDRLQISAQLIDTSDGYTLWSDRYDVRFKDLFTVEQEISLAIAGALRLKLGGAPWTPPSQTSSFNLDSYNFYLKGLSFARKFGQEGMDKAIEQFEESIRADPNFAPAYAELAECYALLAAHGVKDPREAMPKAKQAAEKAIQLENRLAVAHASLGIVKSLYEWDWAGDAVREFELAHQLDPEDASVHEAYVMAFLIPQGQLSVALREIQEAKALDPLSARIISVEGLTYYYMRQYDQAIAQYQEALRLAPNFFPTHLALGAALERKAEFKEAYGELLVGEPAWPGGLGASLLGNAAAETGNRREALSRIEQLKVLSQRRYISGTYLATVYLRLGDKEQALVWLERAYQQHSPSLCYIKVDPRYDSLRSDPRFQSLLKRTGLE